MRVRTVVLTGLAIAAAVLALYVPGLRLELMGDDYQWVQHAHRAMHRPALLLADLDTFYRPASTWTLVVDRLIWGHRPLGYHLTNVLLHGLAGFGLALAGRRLGLSWPAGWAIGLLWAGSPFSEEPAVSVAIRFEDLLLLAWLGLILSWPGPGQRWSRGRVAGAAALVALAMLSKETWVVTPGLVFALEWAFRKSGARKAALAALPVLGLAIAYAAVYFAVFPGAKGYYEVSLRSLFKVPHELAAFLYFETLVPVQFPLTVFGGLALALVALALALALARRGAAGVVGAGLLLLPTVPTLLVPYLPTRYTAIPYAGFLLLAAWAVTAVLGGLRRGWRLVAVTSACSLGVLMLIAGALLVRADLFDWQRVSDAHRRLVGEARAVAAQLPLQRPILVVRQENDNPLLEITRSPHGLAKLLFARHSDPYALADSAALFEWVLERNDVTVRRFDDGEERFRESTGSILVHRSGGFAWLSAETERLGEVARRLREGGARTRVIRAAYLR